MYFRFAGVIGVVHPVVVGGGGGGGEGGIEVVAIFATDIFAVVDCGACEALKCAGSTMKSIVQVWVLFAGVILSVMIVLPIPVLQLSKPLGLQL